jgi:hypothetical protein
MNRKREYLHIKIWFREPILDRGQRRLDEYIGKKPSMGGEI